MPPFCQRSTQSAFLNQSVCTTTFAFPAKNIPLCYLIPFPRIPVEGAQALLFTRLLVEKWRQMHLVWSLVSSRALPQSRTLSLLPRKYLKSYITPNPLFACLINDPYITPCKLPIILDLILFTSQLCTKKFPDRISKLLLLGKTHFASYLLKKSCLLLRDARVPTSTIKVVSEGV